jgi:hypothetical protein
MKYDGNSETMPEKELLYIEDVDKRRLYYHFTPAALVSNFVPLVVILHDKEGAGAHHFTYTGSEL